MKRYYLIYDGDAQHHATAVEIETHEGLTHQEDIEQLNKVKEQLTALAKDTPSFNLRKLDIIPAEDLIDDLMCDKVSEHLNGVLDKVFNDMNYVAMPLNLLVDKIANEFAKDFPRDFHHFEDLLCQAADEGTRLTLIGYHEGDDIPIQEIVVPNMEFYKM